MRFVTANELREWYYASGAYHGSWQFIADQIQQRQEQQQQLIWSVVLSRPDYWPKAQCPASEAILGF